MRFLASIRPRHLRQLDCYANRKPPWIKFISAAPRGIPTSPPTARRRRRWCAPWPTAARPPRRADRAVAATPEYPPAGSDGADRPHRRLWFLVVLVVFFVCVFC